jgi:renalase
VTVFDKAREVGGRMSTRHARWTGADGQQQSTGFDHGAPDFTARSPRFKAMLRRAALSGCVTEWQARVHSTRPGATHVCTHVAVPGMPALARHLLDTAALRLHAPVMRLQRCSDGWQVVLAGGEVAGSFQQVLLAMPPAQAAVLLAGHHDEWADALSALRMLPCWALMAATDDVDWPWDAAVPAAGPLAWVARNDRKPGRTAPPGHATWTAHASAEWSEQHLDADADEVATRLRDALARLLPPPAGGPLAWHHAVAHRWRYAVPAGAAAGGREFWWDAGLGLGVCGDCFTGGQVEGAWRSGDELADTVAAWLDTPGDAAAPAAAAPPGVPAHDRGCCTAR